MGRAYQVLRRGAGNPARSRDLPGLARKDRPAGALAERFQWGAGFSLQPGFSPALWTHEFTEDRLKSVRRLKPAPHANAENIFMRSKT